jgi:hypothetical protein
MRFAAVAGQRSMSDMSTYVWRCLDGHEFAVSEETMRLATIQPRCGIDSGDGTPCNARLACRMRRYPELNSPLDDRTLNL